MKTPLILIVAATLSAVSTGPQVVVNEFHGDRVWKFYDGETVCYASLNTSLNVGPGISCFQRK